MTAAAQPYEPIQIPVDGYVRVSRVGDRSGDSYISPDIQAEAIQRLADLHGFEVIIREPDENESGGTMDRPVFNEIMKRVRSGESGGIVVYTLDRFARTLIGGYTHMAEIAEHNAIFASATEPAFDFTTSSGRLMLQLHLMMAEYFRSRMTEAWEVTVNKAVARGIHPAPFGGFGFDRVNRRFVPNPDEAPLVAEAFRMRVEDGASYGAIGEWLNSQLPNRLIDKHGEPMLRSWNAQSVRRMTRRRIYIGEAHWGLGTGRSTARVNPTVNKDAHDALVSEAMFDRCQEPAPGYTTRGRPDTPVALLAGRIRCQGCRYVMSQREQNSHGTRTGYYGCKRTHTSGSCPAPAFVGADRVEDYVEGLWIAELDRRSEGYAGSTGEIDLRAALAEQEEATAALEEMRADTAARRRLGARWLDWIEPFLRDVEAADAAVRAITSQLDSSVHGLSSFAYRASTRAERAAVLGDAIDYVVIKRSPAGAKRGMHAPALDESRVFVCWRGEGNVPLPRKSTFVPRITSFPWPEDEVQPRVAAA